MVGSIVYWIKVEFSPFLFTIGLMSGICESLGKTAGQTASVIGLAGPASAIASLSGVELVLFEALKN